MSNDQLLRNKQLVDDFIQELFTKGDPTAVDRYLDAEFVDHDPPIPGIPPGAEGLRRGSVMFRQAFPDWHSEVHQLVAEGDIVVERFTASGTHSGSELLGAAPSGSTVVMQGINIFRIRDDKITERWGRLDDAGFLRQLGFDPVVGAARRSRLDRPAALELAETEYGRVADLLGVLTPDQWAAPTDCEGWDVRAVAGHILGMAQLAASVRELIRQQRASRRNAGPQARPDAVLNALTAYQVSKNAALSGTELIAAVRAIGKPATVARRRMPAFVRNLATIPAEVGGEAERWTMGYLNGVILTRDPWMHRIDICRATA